MDQEEIGAALEVIDDMVHDRVITPIQHLLDCLLFQLMAQNSIDYEKLAGRLEDQRSLMTPDELASPGGQLYERYRQLMVGLRDTPEAFLRGVARTGQEGEATPRPDWLQEVIRGGLDKDE